MYWCACESTLRSSSREACETTFKITVIHAKGRCIFQQNPIQGVDWANFWSVLKIHFERPLFLSLFNSLSLSLSFCCILLLAAQKYVYKWAISKELSQSLSARRSGLSVEQQHIDQDRRIEILGATTTTAVSIRAAAATQVSMFFTQPGLYKVKVVAYVVSEGTGSGRHYVVDWSFLQVTKCKWASNSHQQLLLNAFSPAVQ